MGVLEETLEAIAPVDDGAAEEAELPARFPHQAAR